MAKYILLKQAAASKGDSKRVFWDLRDYPDACKLSGRYPQQGNRILLKLVIKSPAQRTEHQLEAGTKEELVKLILERASAF